MSNQNNGDDFVADLILAGVLACAAYGAYKIVQNVTRTPEQRLVENLGRNLPLLETTYEEE